MFDPRTVEELSPAALLTRCRRCVCWQLGIFVADVTSVLAEEESEAMKRYTQSAMGKSFSRKTSRLTLPSKKASQAKAAASSMPLERPSQSEIQ